MKKKLVPLVIATAISLILGAIETQAASIIGVNFQGAFNSGTTLAAGDSAGVVAATNWNNIAAATSGSVANLNDNTGVASGVSFSYSGSDTGYSITRTAGVTPDQKLLYGFASAPAKSGSGLTGGVENTPLTLHFSGLSYSAYNVYVYYESDAANRNGWISSGTVTWNATTGQFASTTGTIFGVQTDPTNSLAGTYVQATNTTILPNGDSGIAATYSSGNYVLFNNQTGSSFDITFGVQSDPGWGIAGVEIVAIPEPSSVCLIGLAVAVILVPFARRRLTVA